MADVPICPGTGEPMVRDVRPLTLTYKGLSTTIDMPGWYSEEEGIFTAEDMAVSDRALRSLKAEADGLLKPDEIRRVRKALHLTQREASELLGGGPNSFQKYESGEVLPSRALCNLLRVLERHPDGVTQLKEVEAQSAIRHRDLVAA
jgi:HTH-type transcriptional regulator/antitoxin MqsA